MWCVAVCACAALLVQGHIVGWILHCHINRSSKQLLGRLGDLDSAVVAANLPIL